MKLSVLISFFALLSFQSVAQRLEEQDMYKVLVHIEGLLHKGNLSGAREYLTRNQGRTKLFAEALQQLDRLESISKDGEAALKKRNYAQAISILVKYREIKILNNQLLVFFENKIEQALRLSLNRTNTEQERIILAFEHVYAGRTALATQADAQKAGTHFERARTLAGNSNATLRKQIDEGMAAVQEVEKILSLKESDYTPAELRTEFEKYKSIPGVPVIIPFENRINTLVAIIEGWNDIKSLVDRCQLDLLLSHNTLSENDRDYVRQLKEISYKIGWYENDNIKSPDELIRRENIIGSAYNSQLKITGEFPEMIKEALRRCVNEKKAGTFGSLGKSADKFGQYKEAARLYREAANSTDDSIRKAVFFDAEEQAKERARCNLEQFQPKIDEIRRLIQNCELPKAHVLWIEIESEPRGNCPGSAKIREKFHETGETINRLLTNQKTFNKLVAELKTNVRKINSQRRKQICDHIQNLDVCDSNVKNDPQIRSICNPKSYLALGYEGGLIAPYGFRLEFMGKRGVGFFTNFRTSLVKTKDIIAGKKVENKNELVAGLSFRALRILHLNFGAGPGYSDLLYRNDYEGLLTTKRAMYLTGYGGLTVRLGKTVALSSGASFMNEGNGFYKPEYTAGLTFRLTGQ